MQSYLDIPVAGQNIAACLHLPAAASAATPAPVVICCHGLTGTRVGSCYRQVAVARQLEAEGIATLRFDFRGCGESDGRFIDLTPASLVEDLLAVLASLQDLPTCDTGRLGIVGSSFGAFTAAQACAQMTGLRCLVFWAPVADLRQLMKEQMPPAAWRLLRERGWVDHHGLPLGRAFFEQAPQEDGPTRLARHPQPLLIFHGTGDRQIPFEHAAAYAKAVQATGRAVHLEALDTEDHALRGVELNERIIRESAAWLRRHLS